MLKSNENHATVKVFLLWLCVSVFFVFIDQATKHIALNNLSYLKPVNMFYMFSFGIDFTLVFNEGAAFSFLSDAGGWQRWFFASFAIFAVVALSVYLLNILKSNTKEVLRPLAVSLILSGALGNLIDRVLLGHVIDFISVYYQNWYWPAFNIADMCISFGIMLLFVEMLFIKNKFIY